MQISINKSEAEFIRTIAIVVGRFIELGSLKQFWNNIIKEKREKKRIIVKPSFYYYYLPLTYKYLALIVLFVVSMIGHFVFDREESII